MGIEIPEEFGGAAGTFFEAVLAVEAISTVDPAVGVLVDVQNTLVHQRPRPLGHRSAEAEVPARASPATRSEPTRSPRPASGSDAFALQTRATRNAATTTSSTAQKLWITNAHEAGLFIVFATLDPAAGYKGITAFLVEKGHARIHPRQERRQARHPRHQHLRARLRRLRHPRRQRPRRTRQRLQDRHRDPERRPHRHRRADARPRRTAPGDTPRVGQGAQAVRQAHRRIPGHAVPARRDGHRDRSRAPDGLQRRPPQGRAARLPQRSRHVPSSSPPR